MPSKQNSIEPSRDAHFIAFLLVAIIAVPNVVATFWTPGICATFDMIFQEKPLPYATQWLRAGYLAFIGIAVFLPALSFVFYFRSWSALFSAGLLILSLLLSVFIGLAWCGPLILITRQMAIN